MLLTRMTRTMFAYSRWLCFYAAPLQSVGAIDETAMQTLSLMTRVTDSVKVHLQAYDDTVLADHARLLLDVA